jgi:hypothetical protein
MSISLGGWLEWTPGFGVHMVSRGSTFLASIVVAERYACRIASTKPLLRISLSRHERARISSRRIPVWIASSTITHREAKLLEDSSRRSFPSGVR